MWGRKLWLFPVSVFIVFPLTFFISYGVAVANGHVSPGFPFISDTGTQPPESCIFGQLLNISAVLAGITLYIRFRDVQETLLRRETMQHSCVRLSRVNNIGLVLGLISAFGASLVANFQESNVIVVHLIGALMTFGVGMVYCWLQTYITYKLCWPQSARIAHIRLAISITTVTFFILLLVTAAVASNKFTGDNSRKWAPDQGGYAEHVVSTASEWIMAIAMMFFFLTFVKEFRDFGLRGPTYYKHSELGDNRTADLSNGHSVRTSGNGKVEAVPQDSPTSSPREPKNHINGSTERIMTV